MKIIRLSTFLDFGGVEKRLTNIAHVQDDNEWIFCSINKAGKAEHEIKSLDKRTICLNVDYNIPSFNTIIKLYKLFRAEKPDVIHTSGAEANFHGIIAAKLAGVPRIIAEEIGVPNQGKLSKRIFGFLYRGVDYVVGNSKPVLNYLRLNNSVQERKLKLIPNPIILKDLGENNKLHSNFTIVSVSRLEQVKNLEGLIRVVSRLVDKGFEIEYNIVGSGAEENNLRQLVHDLNMTDTIHFLGYQSNPYEFLLNSDVYVINSFTEGFSNSLIEAMYSGTPSISTRSGSAEEIIHHGSNGWLVNVDDDESLYNTLLEVIEMDENLRDEVGLKGREYVIENYSLESHISKLMDIYQK